MSDLLKLLGRDNLDRLSAAAGGTRLFVPKHYGKPPRGGRDTSARLVALVGPELAILLVFHFGDSRIYVPKARDAGEVDRRKLKRLSRSNLSDREIAFRLGGTVTERAIGRLRTRQREKQHGTSRSRNV